MLLKRAERKHTNKEVKYERRENQNVKDVKEIL